MSHMVLIQKGSAGVRLRVSLPIRQQGHYSVTTPSPHEQPAYTNHLLIKMSNLIYVGFLFMHLLFVVLVEFLMASA